jgi:hypothetical protein
MIFIKKFCSVIVFCNVLVGSVKFSGIDDRVLADCVVDDCILDDCVVDDCIFVEFLLLLEYGSACWL